MKPIVIQHLKLYPAQEEAFLKFIHNPRAITIFPTGSGKTLLGVACCLNYKNDKILIVVQTEHLMHHWKKFLNDFAIDDVGFVGAGSNDFSKRITIAIINSVRDMTGLDYDFLMGDECLNGDTLIDTEVGQIRINSIVNNNLKLKILSYNHKKNNFEYKNILRYIKKEQNYDKYEITLRNEITGMKTSITCTGNHKLFVNNSYIEASKIKIGDTLYHRKYVCPICGVVLNNNKSIGGHYNINHKHRNQDMSISVRKKISNTVKNNIKTGVIKAPFLLVGNGRGMSVLEKIFFDTYLNSSWIYNYVVRIGDLKLKNHNGYNYKIDFYNKNTNIGIEIDGKIHKAVERKNIDSKKSLILLKKNIKLLRFDYNDIKNEKFVRGVINYAESL